MPSMLPGRVWRFCRDPSCSGGAHRKQEFFACYTSVLIKKAIAAVHTWKPLDLTPRSHDTSRRPLGTSTCQSLVPSARTLVCKHIRAAILFYVRIWAHVVRIRYRRPSQNVKNLTRSTPGAIIDDLERRVAAQTSAQALGTLFVHTPRWWYGFMLGFGRI
jgi:hypothetical protein